MTHRLLNTILGDLSETFDQVAGGSCAMVIEEEAAKLADLAIEMRQAARKSDCPNSVTAGRFLRCQVCRRAPGRRSA